VCCNFSLEGTVGRRFVICLNATKGNTEEGGRSLLLRCCDKLLKLLFNVDATL